MNRMVGNKPEILKTTKNASDQRRIGSADMGDPRVSCSVFLLELSFFTR